MKNTIIVINKPGGDYYFPYSDPEKTLLDLVYFKEKMSKEVLQNFKKKISFKKINIYLKKYPSTFRKKVLRMLAYKKLTI